MDTHTFGCRDKREIDKLTVIGKSTKGPGLSYLCADLTLYPDLFGLITYPFTIFSNLITSSAQNMQRIEA